MIVFDVQYLFLVVFTRDRVFDFLIFELYGNIFQYLRFDIKF